MKMWNSEKHMKGWKMWAGGLITIAVGVYLVTKGQVEMGLGFIGAGLSGIGLGHKFEKGIKLLKE